MKKILLLGLLALVANSLAGCAVYVPERPHYYYGRTVYYESAPVIIEHRDGWHRW